MDVKNQIKQTNKQTNSTKKYVVGTQKNRLIIFWLRNKKIKFSLHTLNYIYTILCGKKCVYLNLWYWSLKSEPWNPERAIKHPEIANTYPRLPELMIPFLETFLLRCITQFFCWSLDSASNNNSFAWIFWSKLTEMEKKAFNP